MHQIDGILSRCSFREATQRVSGDIQILCPDGQLALIACPVDCTDQVLFGASEALGKISITLDLHDLIVWIGLDPPAVSLEVGSLVIKGNGNSRTEAVNNAVAGIDTMDSLKLAPPSTDQRKVSVASIAIDLN